MHPSRQLWLAYEPIHAIAYSHPAFAEDLAARGLTGGWNGYFAGRAAPLGEVPAAVVTALFYGFAQVRVDRAFPKVWQRISPAEVIISRLETSAKALAPASAGVDPPALEFTVDALERAVDSLKFDGRALAAAWAQVPRPTQVLARLWLATSVLREYRGDGHVIAAVNAGLTGIQASLTHVATGQIPAGPAQQVHGWEDHEWQTATSELIAREVLQPSGQLTDAGNRLRQNLELKTDELAASIQQNLGKDADRVSKVLVTISRELIDRGDVVVPNPAGLERP